MEKLKQTVSVIKQDIESKCITSVESISSENFSAELQNAKEVFVDCDLDSVLCLGDYGRSDIKPVTSYENFIFPSLIPVVALDSDNKVLMQAFVNKEALENTLNTGFANYFSRSRNKIWLKGESSDNKQKILNIYFSQKGSFFIYVVNQKKAACHEGFYSCFFRKMELNGGFTQIDFDRKFLPEKVYG
ncbi:MAG: phosphoribosyl-AMP cyclohydrolase [Leptospiraceae bacterium]|nr:phosphoribosyl-AMP cyclohydrolase [Leptospiraceae bacterium]